MRKTILLVDDDPDLIELLRHPFTEAGFAVVTAATGLDALKMARSRSPDLIVLDLILPEIDGFTVCQTLRKEPATARIPVVLLTGVAGELNRFAGLDCGANDYVRKPVTPEDLLSRIQLLLRASPENTPAQRPAEAQPESSP